MAKQSLKEIHEFVSLLATDPTSIHLVPTKNTHIPKKKGDNYYRLNYFELDRRWQEGHLDLQGYDGLKLDPSSLVTENLAFILIDFDDKNETGEIFKGINPPPTLTIKTPTGAGEQRLYLVSREFTNQLVSEKYTIGDNKLQAEIFILDGRTRRLVVLPGLIKNSKEYTLKGQHKIAFLDENTKAILHIQNDEIESRIKSTLRNHADKFNCPPDLPENKTAYRRYLRRIADEIIEGIKEPIAQPGRDDKLYSILCEGATYNLSSNLIADMVISEIIDKSEGPIKVFIDPENEFSHDFICEKAKYVVEKIIDIRRNNERAFTALIPWPRDEENKLPESISRKQLEERAKHIASRGRKYLHGSPTQQVLFIEMIAQEEFSGFFAVPKYDTSPYYQEKYETSLKQELLSDDRDIDISIIKQRPRLVFDQLSPKALNDVYTFIGPNGKHLPITRHPHFYNLISHGKFENAPRPDYVLGSVVNIYSEPPLVPSETITQERIDKANWYMRRHFATLLPKDNFEEEYEYHINWYANKVQNPENRNRTILYYSGPQGSGKSVFVNLVGLMMPENSFAMVSNVKDLEGQFFEFPSLLFLDEGDIHQKEVLEIIKSVVTSDTRKQQEKYKMGKNVNLNVDLVVANNHPIPDDLYDERRVVPAEGPRGFDSDRINREVREFLLEIKKNDWQMGRDIAYILHNRDLSGFKTKYESAVKIERRFKRALDNNPKLIRCLINLIANCGYIGNTPILIPGQRSNTYDLIAIMTIVYASPELATGGIKLNRVKVPQRTQIRNIFGETDSGRERYAYFKDNWPIIRTCTSRFWPGISDSAPNGQTHGRLVPPIGKWLELLTFVIHKKTDDVLQKQIVEMFDLRAQLEWDGKSKPQIENLGYIDKAEAIGFIIGEECNEDGDEF